MDSISELTRESSQLDLNLFAKEKELLQSESHLAQLEIASKEIQEILDFKTRHESYLQSIIQNHSSNGNSKRIHQLLTDLKLQFESLEQQSRQVSLELAHSS